MQQHHDHVTCSLVACSDAFLMARRHTYARGVGKVRVELRNAKPLGFCFGNGWRGWVQH